MTLTNLPQDIWTIILQFFTMEDMLNSEKLFCISRRIFSSLIGSEIDQFNNNNNNNNITQCSHDDDHDDVYKGDDGGNNIFYRVLNEKLLIRQLELTMDRILNRPIYVNGVNDYDEETNVHNYKPLMEKQNSSERGRVRRRYYTRSRLNVLSNSQSMSKLRGELRALIIKCQEQFPHIYQLYRNRIEDALKRSIKICTMVEKPVNNSDNIEYNDNSTERPNKPSIWNEEKRRKSIEIPFKSAKNLKNHQWRVQWSFNYSNHLHHELEFLLKQLGIYYKLIFKNYSTKECITIENYIDLVERVLELLSKFGNEFQKQFFTTRNYFKKKRNRFQEPNQPIENHKIDFIYQVISCLSKRVVDKVLDNSTTERIYNLIERLMDIYLNSYDTTQEYCYGKSIYDLLVRFDRKTLFEKYTSNNEINNLPQHLQESFLISCANYARFFPVELLKSLDIPLIIVKNTQWNKPLSFGDMIIHNNRLWDMEQNTNLWLEEWLNLLVDKFGKQEVLDSLDEASLIEINEEGYQTRTYDDIYGMSKGNRYQTLQNIFGEELSLKLAPYYCENEDGGYDWE